MDKEDQIIMQLQAIERESKVIRILLMALLVVVSLSMLTNGFSG